MERYKRKIGSKILQNMKIKLVNIMPLSSLGRLNSLA